MKTLLTILSLLLLITASSVAQEEYERVVKETFKTSGKPAVDIDTQFGSVHVNAVSGNTVNAVVSITVFNGSKKAARRIADAVHVEIKGGGDKVTIRTKLPDEFSEDGEDHNIDIEVTVTMPVNSKLTVDSKFGTVDITGVKGSVEADCRFGSVEIKNCANVLAENAFGDLSLGNISGTMQVETKMGQVIAYNVPGGKIESSYGDVEVSHINGKLNVKSSMGSLTLKGLRNGEISNSYGSVEIIVHKSFSGRIAASSSFGSIDSDYELKSKKKSAPGEMEVRKYGTFGKGSDKITIKSSFGDVTLEKE
jgi:hypothetical protein